MNVELIVLRLLHVLGAILWVGSGLFTYLVLMPALRPGTPAFGEVMAGLQRRKLFTVLPIAAIVTMLSGLRLMQILSNGFSSQWFELRSGRMFAAAGLASILAFVLSLVVSRPAGVRMGALMAQRQQAATDADRTRIDAELAVLRKRSSVSTVVAMVLLVFAACGMAVARYL